MKVLSWRAMPGKNLTQRIVRKGFKVWQALKQIYDMVTSETYKHTMPVILDKAKKMVSKLCGCGRVWQ